MQDPNASSPDDPNYPSYTDANGHTWEWDGTHYVDITERSGTPPTPLGREDRPPAPVSTESGSGLVSGGSGIYAPWAQTFTPPDMLNLGGPTGLSFIPPVPSFNFTPPTAEEAAADPGYQFTLGEGERALEQSAAGRGVLNTSGTLKNLVDYGQNAASTQYNNVYNRDFGLAHAKFDPLMTQYTTLASAGQRQNELNYDEAWAQYLEKYKEYTDWQNADWTRKYQAASL